MIDMPDRSRRRLTVAALLAAVANSSMAERTYRVGTLGVQTFDPSDSPMLIELARLGYVVGRNLQLIVKTSGNDVEQLDALAAELVASNVDAIVTLSGATSAKAARRATDTIPIVMTGSRDPVEDGLVASLAKPGGNVTGNADVGEELSVKRMQLLLEALAKPGPVGVLVYEPFLQRPSQRRINTALEAFARARGRELVVAPVRKVDRGDDLDRSLGLLRSRAVVGVLVSDWATIGANAERVGSSLVRHGLASIMEWSGFAEAGVLMTYSEAADEAEKRVAHFLDRIFKGARPADMPIERASRFELAINLKTAAALQITIPKTLLLRADTLIR